ncbi:MAG: hypothetical protein U5L11_14170 [Arhodomonas sp.]|nr:hypothetical protein [Arhodomonas sp.]
MNRYRRFTTALSAWMLLVVIPLLLTACENAGNGGGGTGGY